MFDIVRKIRARIRTVRNDHNYTIKPAADNVSALANRLATGISSGMLDYSQDGDTLAEFEDYAASVNTKYALFKRSLDALVPLGDEADKLHGAYEAAAAIGVTGQVLADIVRALDEVNAASEIEELRAAAMWAIIREDADRAEHCFNVLRR